MSEKPPRKKISKEEVVKNPSVGLSKESGERSLEPGSKKKRETLRKKPPLRRWESGVPPHQSPQYLKALNTFDRFENSLLSSTFQTPDSQAPSVDVGKLRESLEKLRKVHDPDAFKDIYAGISSMNAEIERRNTLEHATSSAEAANLAWPTEWPSESVSEGGSDFKDATPQELHKKLEELVSSFADLPEEIPIPDADLLGAAAESIVAGEQGDAGVGLWKDDRLAALKAQVRELEYKAGHPIPGALKQNYEPRILELEDEIYKLEGTTNSRKKSQTKQKVKPSVASEAPPVPVPAEVLTPAPEVRVEPKPQPEKKPQPEAAPIVEAAPLPAESPKPVEPKSPEPVESKKVSQGERPPVITLAEEPQIELPPAKKSGSGGGVYDSSFWTGRNFKGFPDPETGRPAAEVVAPVNAPPIVPTAPFEPISKKTKRTFWGIGAALGLAGLTAVRVSKLAPKYEGADTNSRATISKVEAQPPVPNNDAAPATFTIPDTIPEAPPADQELTPAEEAQQELVSITPLQHEAVTPEIEESEPAAEAAPIGPLESVRIPERATPKPLTEETSRAPVAAPQVEVPAKKEAPVMAYGESPQSFRTKNVERILVDPTQSALFADKEGIVTVYGGGFDSRAALAKMYIDQHPGAHVRIQVDGTPNNNFYGDYSINPETGLQQMVPVDEPPPQIGFFGALYRNLFKSEPKLDPNTFIRKIGG